MLKVVMNCPSEISFLAVGQNLFTEIFVTSFCLLKWPQSLSSTAGKYHEDKLYAVLSNHTPQLLGLHQHYDKPVSRNDVPLAKN